MANKDDVVQISNINLGGLSDSILSGVSNSVARLIGFDLHTIPGLLPLRQKLKKVSGTTVTELCKSKVVVPNGDVYFFSYTSGKVWKWKKSDGTVSLVYTTAPTSGNAGCLGARLYDNKIYFATQNYLHFIAVADLSDWNANAHANYQELENHNSLFHPMKEVNLVLYIGDGNEIHQVESEVFTSNAFDLPAEQIIKVLGRYNTDLIVGTYVSDYVSETQVAKWNTYSTSFTYSDPINECGINAFMESDDANLILVQAGKHGHIYYYNGQTLELYKSVPGIFDQSNYGLVNPEAVASFPKMMLFGFSAEAGNPCDMGIYAFGRHNRNYPFVLDLSFPISERDVDGDFILSGIEIGCIAVSGFDILCSWKHGTSYGIDCIDYNNKIEKGILEGRVAKYPRNKLMTFREIFGAYYSMPEGTSINIYRKVNYATEWAGGTVTVDEDRKIVTVEESPEGNVIQLKAEVNSSGNDAPILELLQINPDP